MYDYERVASTSTWFKAFLAKHAPRYILGIARDLAEGEGKTLPEAEGYILDQFRKGAWADVLAKLEGPLAKALDLSLRRAFPDLSIEEGSSARKPYGVDFSTKMYAEMFEYETDEDRVEAPSRTQSEEIARFVRTLGGVPTVDWDLEPDPRYRADNLVYKVKAALAVDKTLAKELEPLVIKTLRAA